MEPCDKCDETMRASRRNCSIGLAYPHIHYMVREIVCLLRWQALGRIHSTSCQCRACSLIWAEGMHYPDEE